MPPLAGEKIAWGAQDIRATVFMLGSVGRIDDLFATAFDLRPDTYSENLNQSQAAQASGMGPLGQLSIARSPGRFDIVLQPIQAPNAAAPPGSPVGTITHPAIKDVDAGIDSIQKAVSRLGVALNLAVPASSIDQCNLLMNTVLPYGIELCEENDFFLQTNIISRNAENNIDINCVSTWRTSAVQQINLLANVGTGISSPAQIINLYYISQKVIDINTAQRVKPLTAADNPVLLPILIHRLREAMTIS